MATEPEINPQSVAVEKELPKKSRLPNFGAIAWALLVGLNVWGLYWMSKDQMAMPPPTARNQTLWYYNPQPVPKGAKYRIIKILPCGVEVSYADRKPRIVAGQIMTPDIDKLGYAGYSSRRVEIIAIKL